MRLGLAGLSDDTCGGSIPIHRLHGRGDHAMRIATCQAHPDVPDVDTETLAAGQWGLFAHAATAASIALRTADSAAPISTGAPPPTCAMSSFQPPRPPID